MDPDAARFLELAAHKVGLDGATYTIARASDAAGIPEDVARRFWRALGFSDPGADEPVLTAADVEILRLAQPLAGQPFALEEALAGARMVAASVRRIAERPADFIRALRRSGLSWEQVVAIAEVFDADLNLRLIDHIYRRLALDALRREALEPGDGGSRAAIGFADIVGWTNLAESLSDADIGEITRRLETIAHEAAAANSGRLIKMIGDSAMFEAATIEAAVAIARAIVTSPDLPPLRSGVAVGEVVKLDGDCFGPVVHLANRLVHAAEPRSVAVPQQVVGLDAVPIGVHELKGLGPTEVWLVR